MLLTNDSCQILKCFIFQLKKNQERIFMILDSKHIPYEAVDVAQDEEAKLSMRRLANDSKALPPQICKGDSYCGVSLTPCQRATSK